MIQRALGDPIVVEQLVSVEELPACRRRRGASTSTPPSRATRSRSPSRPAGWPTAALADLAEYVTYGASPRGPINLVLGARALALLRGRRYVLPQDVRELAKDVLRHRMVLSYEALAEGVEADTVLDRVLEAVPMPAARSRPRGRRVTAPPRALAPLRTPARPGPGPLPGQRCCAGST